MSSPACRFRWPQRALFTASLLVSLLPVAAVAQRPLAGPTSKDAAPQADAATSAAPSKRRFVAASGPPPVTQDVLDARLRASEKRLINAIKDDKSFWEWLGPALIAALSAIGATAAAGWVSYRLQRDRTGVEQRAALRRAGVEALLPIHEFRARQLNEFYAPLQALLAQSLGIRRELYRGLRDQAPPGISFYDMDDPKAVDGKSLFVVINGDSKRFRLVQEIDWVFKTYPLLAPFVDEFVDIGTRITQLIHSGIGLVRPENQALVELLARYLTHHVVLRQRWDHARGATSGGLQRAYYSAYPRGLDRLVAEDCELLRDELSTWEATVRRWQATAEP